MVYWKLDNQTIRCLINKEEISKMGFDLNAISTDAGIMTEFLEAIVSDSRNYIDWNTDNGVQNYIAKALPADQYLFTISCTYPEDMINQDLRQIRRMINALNAKIPIRRIDAVEKMSGEEKELAFAALAQDLKDVCNGKIDMSCETYPEWSGEDGPGNNSDSGPADGKEETGDGMIMPPQKITFHSMEELMEFCSVLDTGYSYPSSLLRLKDDYILLVEFDQLDDQTDIIRFLISAEEYGARCESSALSRYYVLEHGELLIPQDALRVLISMAR
ncbi:MAG: adaptor protein MecA [Eubacterium sp.]|nr:adaptor protein MecA [Eubacterium sp.]